MDEGRSEPVSPAVNATGHEALGRSLVYDDEALDAARVRRDRGLARSSPRMGIAEPGQHLDVRHVSGSAVVRRLTPTARPFILPSP